MARYRMSLPAQVCFDVTANSPEEARQKATKVAEDLIEGMDVPDLGMHGRCYLDEEAAPEINDVDDPTDYEEIPF